MQGEPPSVKVISQISRAIYPGEKFTPVYNGCTKALLPAADNNDFFGALIGGGGGGRGRGGGRGGGGGGKEGGGGRGGGAVEGEVGDAGARDRERVARAEQTKVEIRLIKLEPSCEQLP